MKFSTESYIKMAKEIYGYDVYDYSDTIYIDRFTNIMVWCYKHRCYVFVNPIEHLRGIGCKQCASEGIHINFKDARKFIDMILEETLVPEKIEVVKPNVKAGQKRVLRKEQTKIQLNIIQRVLGLIKKSKKKLLSILARILLRILDKEFSKKLNENRI